MKLRPPTLADAEAVGALLNDVTMALYGSPEISANEMRLWFDAPDFDLERDAVVAAAENGSIVGFGDLSDPSRVGRVIWIDAQTRLGATEIANAILDELEPRAEERLAPDGRLKAFVPEKNTAYAAVVEARGYALVRHSFRMEADLADEPAEPQWPEGITVREFRPGQDDERVYEVQEETFADQADAEPMSYEEWRHWSFREPFDPDLWFVAEDGGDVAGILLARSERAGDETLGWVSVLGVRRPWRRRGLGRALLLHSFHALRARGKPRAGLGVDGSNPTGAVRLYEAAGMRVVRRNDHWEKERRV
ncbi:MAG: GNAT family N-acetyltransferase [Gaiellaceae bacterium]